MMILITAAKETMNNYYNDKIATFIGFLNIYSFCISSDTFSSKEKEYLDENFNLASMHVMP